MTDGRCMVNNYLKEDKCFREKSDRSRKIFIFANCMTQNKGEDGGVAFIENMVLNPSEGRYGVNVGKNVWHTVEALEPGSVIFECKEGPYVPHEVEGILEVDS